MRSYDIVDLRSRFSRAFSYSIIPDHNERGHRYQRSDTGEQAWSVTTKLALIAKPYLYTWYVKRAVEYVQLHRLRLDTEFDTVLEEARGAAVRSRDSSADIGTTAHDAYDRYLRRWITITSRPEGSAVVDLETLCREHEVEPKGEEIAACRSFDKFLDENEIIPLASEIRVWYQKGKDTFAGTVDAIFLRFEIYKDRNGKKACLHDYIQQPNGTLWCAQCSREVTSKLILGDWKTSNAIKGKDEYGQQSEAYAQALQVATGIKFDEIWVIRFGKGRAEYEICKVSDRKAAWREWIAISRAFDEKERRGETGLLVPLKEKIITRL